MKTKGAWRRLEALKMDAKHAPKLFQPVDISFSIEFAYYPPSFNRQSLPQTATYQRNVTTLATSMIQKAPLVSETDAYLSPATAGYSSMVDSMPH
jgi:hypothetical protein